MTNLWDNYTINKGATSFPFEILKKYSNGNILDLGCGDGTHARGVYDLSVGNVFGIDISDYIISRAKDMHPGIKFKRASAYKLPYKDNFFDFIYSIDIIEHLDYPEKMLEEASRVLKDGGVFVIQTPNYPVKRLYDFYNSISKKGFNRSIKDDPTHFYKFTSFKLKKMCSRYFTVIGFKTRNIFLENRLKFLKNKKNKMPWILFGQKTIIILKK